MAETQLKPLQNFPIQRTLYNPNDSDTHFVRAYIRDLSDDSLIATVDLVDQGGQRFLYSYKVPADPTGEGRYISILIKVFDDAAYTVLSTDYEQQEETYLVQERWNPVLGSGGGGGGVEVDYKKIRKIIKEEIDNRKITPPKEISFRVVLDYLRKVKEEISDFIESSTDDAKKQSEENKKQTVEILKKEIVDIKKAIENLPKPEKLEKVDFTPLKNQIDEITKKITNEELKEKVSVIKDILDRLIEMFKKLQPGATKKDVEEVVKKNDLQFRKDLEPTELGVQEILNKL